jgi:hypothetical protein
MERTGSIGEAVLSMASINHTLASLFLPDPYFSFSKHQETEPT